LKLCFLGELLAPHVVTVQKALYTTDGNDFNSSFRARFPENTRISSHSSSLRMVASPDTPQVFEPATDKDFVPNSARLNPK
jgi:hypothetical protein